MILTSKYAIPKMIDTGSSSIINISSINGLRAGWRAGHISYAAAKGGVIAMTKNMAVHHGRDNVRANCIAPGHFHALFARGIPVEDRNLRHRAGHLGTEGTAWVVA